MGATASRLAERGIVLPPPPTPQGSYVPVAVVGGIAYEAGQITIDDKGVVHPGLVDRDVPLLDAQILTRRATLQALSALKATLGSLDRVRRVVRVAVYVASSPGFVRQHEVANGATDLLVEIFGPEARPARVALGVASLPLNAPVEVEVQVALD